jgi:hypothetical protein
MGRGVAVGDVAELGVVASGVAASGEGAVSGVPLVGACVVVMARYATCTIV